VIQPVTKVTSPTAPAAAPAGAGLTAFDTPSAAILTARNKAAALRAALSAAVRQAKAAVDAIEAAKTEDKQAAQILALEGFDADTLKRFAKDAQPLLAYLTQPTPATP
jgi:hypothetical protein